jgi:hypothetical protein
LFRTGQPINSDTTSAIFSLKPGTVEFKLPAKVFETENLNFFNAILLQNLEIRNYSLFITCLEEKLKENYDYVKDKSILSESDQNTFREQVKLILCSNKCDCCQRLCDIDMRVDQHHKIHKCEYGHQMRAISGIRVEKKKDSTIKYYASVKRCEDIE